MSRFLVFETVEDKIEEFLGDKKAQGICDNTIKTYRNHLKAINIPNGNIDTVNWKKVIQSIWEKNIAEYSKISYLRTLKTFMRWLGIKDFPRIPHIETIKETYTDDELKKLIAKPKKATFTEFRTWVLILLVIDTGLRAGSLRNIKIEDVTDNLVNVRHTKTRKVQSLPFSNTTRMAINSYLRVRKGSGGDYLFCDVYGNQLSGNALKYAVRRYNLRHGVNKTSLHMFRHTFAKKWLLECNGNAFTLQKMLGHSTLDMTKHYTNLWDADLLDNYVSPLEMLKREWIKM